MYTYFVAYNYYHPTTSKVGSGNLFTTRETKIKAGEDTREIERKIEAHLNNGCLPIITNFILVD